MEPVPGNWHDELSMRVLPQLLNNLLIMKHEEAAKEYKAAAVNKRVKCPTILCLDGFVMVMCFAV